MPNNLIQFLLNLKNEKNHHKTKGTEIVNYIIHFTNDFACVIVITVVE